MSLFGAQFYECSQQSEGLKKQVHPGRAWMNQRQGGVDGASYSFTHNSTPDEWLLTHCRAPGAASTVVSRTCSAFPSRELSMYLPMNSTHGWYWGKCSLGLTLNLTVDSFYVEALLIFLLLLLFWTCWIWWTKISCLLMWRKCILGVVVEGRLMCAVGGREHPWTDLFRKLQWNEKHRTDFQTRFPLWKNILRHSY